jgi:hypothetical protein
LIFWHPEEAEGLGFRV